MKKFLSTFIMALLTAGCMFAADNVPWSQDFATNSIVNKWPSYKASSKSRGFVQSSQRVQIQTPPSGSVNDAYLWFTQDGFNLENGKSYRFDIDVLSNRDENTGTKRFAIKVYKKTATSPKYDDPSTQIMYVDKITLTQTTHSAYFEVDETGEYYLCLYAYSDYSGGYIYWDNFNLVEASMDAPDKAGISVVPDANGVLKAQVSITAPSRTIRGNAITANLEKMVIYRDGGLLKEVTDIAPGAVTTFTDNVAQPGEHIYSVTAYNEKGAGAVSEHTATIGAKVEAATAHYYARYNDIDGKMTIEWLAKSGVTAYQVATIDGRIVTGTPVLNEETGIYSLVDNDFVNSGEPTGWQYKIGQTNDDGTVTHLGYTNYICLNNEVPYYPSFATAQCLDAFTSDKDPLNNYAWSFSNSAGGHIQNSLSRDYTTKRLKVDWLFSPGLKLSKDKFYRVVVTGGSDQGRATYTIKAGRSNTRAAMDITVTEDRPMVKCVSNNLEMVQTDEMFLSVPQDGIYFIGLTASMAENVSYAYPRIKRFDIIEVDATLPNSPTDMTVHYSSTGGTDGKITFKVPQKAINGNDVTNLTKIEVFKNGELYKTITEGVAPGAELEFGIEVVAGQEDMYTVMAYNNAGKGEAATIKVLVLSTPYSNSFNTKKDFDGFTQISAYHNGYLFEVFNNSLRLFTSAEEDDIWVITPPITLTKDMYYILNFNLKAKNDNVGQMDVFVGKGASPELLDQRVMETINVGTEDNIYSGLKEEYFTVSDNGQYFLAFHYKGKSAGSSYTEVYLDDLSISSALPGTAPDRGELQVIPAPDGSLKAELVYTAATKSLNGNPLNENSTQDVYFYTNGVQTPANRTYKAYPGQKVSINVDVPEDLPYIFSARTGWNGRHSYKDAFVGINTPTYPTNIKFIETQPYGHLVISWDPVTKDIEGYDLYPDLLTYDLSTWHMYQGNIIEDPITTGIKGSSYEYDAISPDAPQTMKSYILRARNPKGKGSQGVITKFVNLGRPYRLPYTESFSNNGTPGTTTATNDETFDAWSHWGLMTDGLTEGMTSADGDGAYLALESLYSGSGGTFITGKVNLASVEVPAMSVMVYNNSTEQLPAMNTIEFMIYTYGDHKWHSLGEAKAVKDLCNSKPGWNKVSVDLSAYADQVAMLGIKVTTMSHTFTSIDNIRIQEYPAKDISVQRHTTPLTATPGAPFSMEVTVANNGREAATPDAVEMHVDGEKVAHAAVKAIAPGETESFSFTHTFPAIDLAPNHEIVFKAVYAEDADQSDNASVPVTVTTVTPELPGVTNLTGNSNDDKSVTLSWDEPKALDGGTTTESFENWIAGAATQHGWLSHDNDRRDNICLSSGGEPIPVPGLSDFQPASFAVVDVSDGNLLPATQFPAKTGNKFLMSLRPDGDTGSADDWIISPLLSGKAQSVTFFAKNYKGYPAQVEVLYSTTGTAIDDFRRASAGSIFVNEWTGCTVDLPEGTRYFAIRNISLCENSFMLMLDDITYDAAGGDDIALKGYNVYEEAQLLNSPVAPSFTITGPVTEGVHTYGVSACYAHGESRVEAVDVNVISGIVSVTAADGIHVFGGKGCIHVTGAPSGSQAAVCSINGALLNSGTLADDGRIAAAKGIYVVTINGSSYKVIVK